MGVSLRSFATLTVTPPNARPGPAFIKFKASLADQWTIGVHDSKHEWVLRADIFCFQHTLAHD